MHIVVMAWLFVVGTMSLTFGGVLAGASFFALAGVAPVAFYAWVKLVRLREMRARDAARTDPGSVAEEGVDDRDHADPGRDQR